MTDIPESRSKNKLLEMHGPNGYLISRLNRYAITGWIAFFLSLSLFIFYVMADKLMPVPVLAVNGDGTVLGTFEYLDPTTRSDVEVIAGSKYFLNRYLSLNSSTIYEDNAAALSMMSVDLRNRKIEEFKATSFLSRAEDAGTNSFVEYDERTGADIIAASDLNRAVRLKGNLVITPQGGETFEKPFDITLELTIVPRNTYVTTGIEINAIRNN